MAMIEIKNIIVHGVDDSDRFFKSFRIGSDKLNPQEFLLRRTIRQFHGFQIPENKRTGVDHFREGVFTAVALRSKTHRHVGMSGQRRLNYSVLRIEHHCAH